MAQLFDKLCLCFFVVGFVGNEGVFAVFGHGFGLWMFECADTAFLIGAYPSPQVGSGDAVVICSTLLAAYVQVAWYLKCNVYLLIKKLHLGGWRVCVQLLGCSSVFRRPFLMNQTEKAPFNPTFKMSTIL